METPKVFISYSWSSEEHVEWVLSLSKKLIDDGVNVIIDRWSLKPGQDKNDFMEKMVKDESVKKVLIICDKLYAEKSDARKGGVGIESQIISPKVYDEVDQEKFIPVVKEINEKGKPYLPIFLKGRFFIDLSDVRNFYEGYEELLRNIFNKPVFVKPPLGHPPSFIIDDNVPPLKSTHKFMTFKDSVFRDKSYSNGLAKDYLNELENYLDSHKINKFDNIHIDEVVIKNIDEYLPLRDEFIDFIFFINSYKKESIIYEAIQTFFSKMIRYIQPDYFDQQLLDNYKYIIYELFLYLIAILIQEECFTELSLFVNKLYYCPDNKKMYSSSNDNLYHYTSFHPYIKTFEEQRKQRLNLNAYNVVSGIMRDRINTKIPLINLVQADYFLFIHSYINQNKSKYIYRNWYPNTLLWVIHGGALPLFVKAASKDFFKKISIPLQINSVEELRQKFNSLCKKNSFPNMQFLWQEQCEAHKLFMNLDKLSTTN